MGAQLTSLMPGTSEDVTFVPNVAYEELCLGSSKMCEQETVLSMHLSGTAGIFATWSYFCEVNGEVFVDLCGQSWATYDAIT